jgi:anti-sigma factor RsiW
MGSRQYAMDHAYIDANSIAERYLDHTLPPEDLDEFEKHLVDCQECADRLLLAEMFHARNGHKPKADPEAVARLVLYKPRRVIMILVAAALAIPLAYLLWRLISSTMQ